MIMREPLGTVVRHLSAEGIGNRAVQMECLRTLVVLLILSRQFLTAGVFFDRVYLQPDAAMKFPRRNYPMDFLVCLTELLVAVAASTTVSLESSPPGGLSPFTILLGVLLLMDVLWLALARAANYSIVPEIAPIARLNFIVFLVCAALYAGTRTAGFGPARADAVVVFVILLLTLFQLAGQVRSYGQA